MANSSDMTPPPGTQCGECGLLFGGLQMEICGKCEKKKGVSEAEQAAIDRKPQCTGCGKVFKDLKEVLCLGCKFAYARLPNCDIPDCIVLRRECYDSIQNYRQELRLRSDTEPSPPVPSTPFPEFQPPYASHDRGFTQAGASPQVRNVTPTSEAAQQIVTHAGIAQEACSSVRIASGPRTDPRPQNPNLKHAVANVASQKDGKKSTQNKVQPIKAAAFLYSRNTALGGKPNAMKMPLFGSFSRTFAPSEPVEAAFQALFALMKESVSRHANDKLPAHLRNLHWDALRFYAHNGLQSAPTYIPLELTTDTSTVGSLFQAYQDNSWGTETMRNTNTMEVRFIYDYSSEDEFEDPMRFSALQRPSQPTQRRSSKRPASEDPGAMPPPPPPKHIRKSAYTGHLPKPTPMEPRWSRKVTVQSFEVTRYQPYNDDPDGGDFDLVRMQDPEPWALEIADIDSWEADAKKLEDRRGDDSGFLGRGSTKFAIYARHDKQEYALTMLQQVGEEPRSYDEQQQLLRQELQLLKEGQIFKDAFDKYVEEIASTRSGAGEKLRFKDFYFNCEGAFVGRFQTNSLYFKKGYYWFLATPLLPTGSIHRGVQKFTGNCKPGKPMDDTEEQIHAFVHWVYLYTHKNMVFCDLQGILDRKRVTALIDPQCHSLTGPDIYWNRKQAGIDEFWNDHNSYCLENQYCCYLDLANLKYDEDSDKESDQLANGSASSNEGDNDSDKE